MVFAIAKACDVLILFAFLQITIVSCRGPSCRPEDDPKAFAGKSVLQDDDGECLIDDTVSWEDDDHASPALALLQKSVITLKKRRRSADVELSESSLGHQSHPGRSISPMAGKTMPMTTTTTSTTTSDLTTTGSTTTMAGIQDFLLFSTSGATDHHIWKFDMVSGDLTWLIRGVGRTDGGIAFDNKQGYLYLALPDERTIIRYVMAIRGDQLMMYDFQPVPIATNVSAEWITVTEQSDVMYTDPETHTINKIYKNTLDLIAQGPVRTQQVMTVDYVEFYEQHGNISKALLNENCSCYKKGYIFQVYTDMGHPSGIKPYTGSTILWGNLVDGYKRGTVVKGEVDPIPVNGKIAPPVALTYAWDSIFNFYTRTVPLGHEDQSSTLFLTLNGTLGVPPIPGDVTGALVAIQPTTLDAPIAESVVMAWDFVKPRGLALYKGSDETIMVADATGVTCMSASLLMEGGTQIKLINQTDVNGMLLVEKEDEAIPVMVNRGDDGKVGQ